MLDILVISFFWIWFSRFISFNDFLYFSICSMIRLTLSFCFFLHFRVYPRFFNLLRVFFSSAFSFLISIINQLITWTLVKGTTSVQSCCMNICFSCLPDENWSSSLFTSFKIFLSRSLVLWDDKSGDSELEFKKK